MNGWYCTFTCKLSLTNPVMQEVSQKSASIFRLPDDPAGLITTYYSRITSPDLMKVKNSRPQYKTYAVTLNQQQPTNNKIPPPSWYPKNRVYHSTEESVHSQLTWSTELPTHHHTIPPILLPLPAYFSPSSTSPHHHMFANVRIKEEETAALTPTLAISGHHSN